MDRGSSKGGPQSSSSGMATKGVDTKNQSVSNSAKSNATIVDGAKRLIKPKRTYMKKNKLGLSPTEIEGVAKSILAVLQTNGRMTLTEIEAKTSFEKKYVKPILDVMVATPLVNEVKRSGDSVRDDRAYMYRYGKALPFPVDLATVKEDIVKEQGECSKCVDRIQKIQKALKEMRDLQEQVNKANEQQSDNNVSETNANGCSNGPVSNLEPGTNETDNKKQECKPISTNNSGAPSETTLHPQISTIVDDKPNAKVSSKGSEKEVVEGSSKTNEEQGDNGSSSEKIESITSSKASEKQQDVDTSSKLIDKSMSDTTEAALPNNDAKESEKVKVEQEQHSTPSKAQEMSVEQNTVKIEETAKSSMAGNDTTTGSAESSGSKRPLERVGDDLVQRQRAKLRKLIEELASDQQEFVKGDTLYQTLLNVLAKAAQEPGIIKVTEADIAAADAATSTKNTNAETDEKPKSTAATAAQNKGSNKPS